MNENEKIELPTNIKQIGAISDGLKVYMEDYVCTYVQQYSGNSGYEEKIAVLIGENYIIDGEEILFISGAIQGKYSSNENGMEVLTEQSWQYINEQMDIYFKGFKIVGWLYIQPGYGDYLNENYINYHLNNFKEPHNVLFISDPMEKVNSFFAVNKSTRKLESLNGYFIYFDKNVGMHEYMLENRPPMLVEDEPKSEKIFTDDKIINRKTDKPLAISHKTRSERVKGKAIAEQKKMVNLLGSLSFVLFLVCFIMGAGLIQNDDRISRLEDELAAIESSYKYILSQVKEDKAQTVFGGQAAQTDNTITTSKEGDKTKEKSTEATTESPVTQSTTVQLQETTIATQVTTIGQNDIAQTTFDIPKTYTVEEGDTLSYISRKFYGSTKMKTKIMEENDLSDPNKIYFGMVLKLPRP